MPGHRTIAGTAAVAARFQTIPPFRATAGDLKQSEKGKIPIAIGQICQKFDSRRVYPVLLE